jgi:hypothetical protein
MFRLPVAAPAPLAPAAPILGRSGAGLALLASFAVGYAIGTWLWNLLNERKNTPLKDQDFDLVNLSQPAYIYVAFTITTTDSKNRRCSNNSESGSGAGGVERFTMGRVGTRLEMKATPADYGLVCEPGQTPTYKDIGMILYNGAVGIDSRMKGVEHGNLSSINYSYQRQKVSLQLEQVTVDGKPVEVPSQPDPSWQPQPLPEIKPAPPEVLPPLLPQPAPPEREPETQPEWQPVPVPPQRPPTSPPVVAPPEPPKVPVRPRPQPPILPPITDPVPPEPDTDPPPEQPPETRPPGTETTPDGEVGQPGTQPRPDLPGIAAEVGRIEQKVLQLLNRPANPPDLTDLVGKLEEILSKLEDTYPAGSYELFPVCETDAGGTPRPPMVTEWPAGTGKLDLVEAKLDAVAELIQFHKELRQPVCNRAPFGEEVTVNWIEDLNTTTRRRPLTKVLRYRDRSGMGVAGHVAHWEGFAWDAGPTIVACNGPWGCVKVWAASEGEGQRVIRHALAAGGWNPDTEPGTDWIATTDTGGRNGQPGRMVVAVDLQGVRITKRRGSDGRPEQIEPA